MVPWSLQKVLHSWLSSPQERTFSWELMASLPRIYSFSKSGDTEILVEGDGVDTLQRALLAVQSSR